MIIKKGNSLNILMGRRWYVLFFFLLLSIRISGRWLWPPSESDDSGHSFTSPKSRGVPFSISLSPWLQNVENISLVDFHFHQWRNDTENIQNSVNWKEIVYIYHYTINFQLSFWMLNRKEDRSQDVSQERISRIPILI